jgi:hypothetical protein
MYRLSMSEHREISAIVNDMPNDYAALKGDLEEFNKIAENLARNLAVQETYIRLIKSKIDEMDKSKIELDEMQEADLRKALERVKAASLRIVSFIKEEPIYDDGCYEEYQRDPIIKIKDECAHETSITTLSNHAFNICRELLGEPVNGRWILR